MESILFGNFDLGDYEALKSQTVWSGKLYVLEEYAFVDVYASLYTSDQLLQLPDRPFDNVRSQKYIGKRT